MLFDTHCHINYPPLLHKRDEVIKRALAAGVEKMTVIGTAPDNFTFALAIAADYPGIVYASVGLHPEHADEFNDNYTSGFEQLLPHVHAVGETGLDYYVGDGRAKKATPAQQLEAFHYHLAVASEHNLPVVVHCREAFDDTVKALKAHPGVQAVLHCFTGTPEQAKPFLDLGAYISISGIVTFKSAKAVHDTARYVPGDRLLIETDAPFLAPVPHRGGVCEPAYVTHTASAVAALREVEYEALVQLTGENACRFFGV